MKQREKRPRKSKGRSEGGREPPRACARRTLSDARLELGPSHWALHGARAVDVIPVFERAALAAVGGYEPSGEGVGGGGGRGWL
eukprot:3401876-Prymnesium_polylepis.1